MQIPKHPFEYHLKLYNYCVIEWKKVVVVVKGILGSEEKNSETLLFNHEEGRTWVSDLSSKLC
jgi:hypothetical protein